MLLRSKGNSDCGHRSKPVLSRSDGGDRVHTIFCMNGSGELITALKSAPVIVYHAVHGRSLVLLTEMKNAPIGNSKCCRTVPVVYEGTLLL